MDAVSNKISGGNGIRLIAWTRDGRSVVDVPVGGKTLALAGRQGADVCVPELAEASAFFRVDEGGGTLIIHHEGGGSGEERHALTVGQPLELGALVWMLTSRPNGASFDSSGFDVEPPSQLLPQVVKWVTRPMPGLAELRSGLKDFLQILLEETPAMSGMLVLAQGKGFDLVASVGLNGKDAQKLWERMPHSLAEEVLRTNARVLLPDELRRSTNGDSTVFVRGVRSVAGFPVLAEGRLLAVFYLGFDNLLQRLSAELQQTLEGAADLLGLVLQRAELREQFEKLKLRAASSPEVNLPASRLMVGSSEKLVEVYHFISRLAPVDVATLILGETGTGKELAAKELHRMSPRGQGAFVVVNAAALPESLIESELFGHKKGAFTGALTDRVGLVEQAHGGTLFIDEIGELSPPMQAKLLRVLQERAVTRIGEAQPRAVDFRLVSATHRNLQEMVATGTFREDLYYRIAGATIKIPSLRERPEDIITLANYFRQQFAERHGLPDKEWSSEALLALERRPWQGNIREMENVVARAFVMAEGSVIRAKDLTSDGAGSSADGNGEGDGVTKFPQARDAWMKSFLKRALDRHNGKRAETAKALGIGERTLFRYIEQLDIGDT